ncbi:glycosyl transferase family 90 [Halomonas sp.]|uniref:glycosyl transferase family 90 n=1 Tax=Halomonas sp. TaxID=1486246 RepID=UPI003A100C66
MRHYYLPGDQLSFEQKRPLAVWRGACHQEHRRRFVRDFHDHPLCNVADIHRNAAGNPWHGDFLSVSEQLRYRYILSIEGKDVATNLKWIMASNSLCLMRRPRFETWFMEGQLRPAITTYSSRTTIQTSTTRSPITRPTPRKRRRSSSRRTAMSQRFAIPRGNALSDCWSFKSTSSIRDSCQ